MRTTEKSSRLKEKMFDLIFQQTKSGVSQIQFCKNKKMSIATFSYWRKKYLEAQPKDTSNNFIALKIKTVPKTNHLIEIQLPNKIVLRCKDWPSNQLINLIDELQKKESSC